MSIYLDQATALVALPRMPPDAEDQIRALADQADEGEKPVILSLLAYVEEARPRRGGKR